jgi:Zn-dependent peptidase ImmA (M78 family)
VATLQETAVSAARVTRQELGVGLEAPFSDILKTVERTGGVPVTIAELPAGLSGALLVDRDVPFIFINGIEHPVRQRFTLAHEYGHWRLGHGEVVDGPGSFGDKSNPDEIQANRFAAEFLAPLPAVRTWMEARGMPDVDLELVVDLSVDFGISALAALIRLETARLAGGIRRRAELRRAVDSGEHRELMFRLGLMELQDTIADAQGRLPRVPGAMRTRAIQGYERGMLGVDRLAGLLRQAPEQTTGELDEAGIVPAGGEDSEPDY